MQALLHEANALVVVDDVVRQDVIAVDNLQRLHANLRLARIHQVAQKHEERRDVLLELRIREHTALLQNALPQFQQCHTLPLTFHVLAHLLRRANGPLRERHVDEVVHAVPVDVEQLQHAREQQTVVLLHHPRDANHHEETLREHAR